MATALPFRVTVPGVRALGPDERARQLRASGAEEAGDAEDLAAPQREAHVAHQPCPA